MSTMERLAFTGRPAERPAAATSEWPGDRRPALAAAAAEPERDRLAFKALLAFMFVLLVRPQDQLPFLAPLHLAELFGVVSFVSVMVGRVNRGLTATRITPEVLGVLAFACLIVATIPLSFWPGGSFQLFTEVFVKIVIIFLVMVNTLTTRRRVEQFTTLVVLGTGYVSVRAVLDYARGVNLVEGGRVAGAVGGLFGNPNDMALNMVAFLPLAIALALDRGRTMLRLLGMIAVPTMAGAIIFSKSRGGTLGFVAMMVVFLFYMRRLRPAVAVAAIVAAMISVPFLPASFTERMSSIVNADQDPTGSREARKTLLREGWQAFLEHPITGLGAGQFQNYNPTGRVEAWRQTHNAPLQVASELGIAGVVIFAFMIVTAFRTSIYASRSLREVRSRMSRRPRSRGAAHPPLDDAAFAWLEVNAAAMVAAMTGWFISALFASVAYYWTFYLLLGLAVAVRDVSASATAPFQTASSRTKSAVVKAA